MIKHSRIQGVQYSYLIFSLFFFYSMANPVKRKKNVMQIILDCHKSIQNLCMDNLT